MTRYHNDMLGFPPSLPERAQYEAPGRSELLLSVHASLGEKAGGEYRMGRKWRGRMGKERMRREIGKGFEKNLIKDAGI